jgi:hypothetical protein
MNIPRVQKRILLYVILPACAIYVGLHFYAQYRHVDVYFMRSAPMPAELASGLHMQEHKIDPTVTIESPYETAADKILSPAELGRVRSAIAWNSEIPAFIDSLSIQSATRVLARRTTSRRMLEYQLVKRGNRWRIESVTLSEIVR